MNMEGRYNQDQTGSGSGSGFCVFSPEMHPNHTVKQHLLHLSLAAATLPGSCTDTAPTTEQGREKGLQTSLGMRIITITQLSILLRLPGSAAATNSPADGSGKLKSSSAQSCAVTAACRSQHMQLLRYPPNQQLLPGPCWLSSFFRRKVPFLFSLAPWTVEELRPFSE